MPRMPKDRRFTFAYCIALLALLAGFVLFASFIAAELLLGVQGERSARVFESQARLLANASADSTIGAGPAFVRSSEEPLRSLRPDALSEHANRTRALQIHRAAALHELPAGVEGVLRIPALDIRVPVYSGTDELALSRGAGRVEWTPPLGSDGNVGVAAHRDRAFRALKDVAKGDEILVDLVEGTLRYEVVETRIVDPEDVHVLGRTETPFLTLVTCYPFKFVGPAPRRFIVHARLTDRAGSVLISENLASTDESPGVAY